MKELSLKTNMKINDIKEHPRNREYFNDIKDTNPAFWLEFKDSIRRFGIIEPLLVNKKTKEIRSGNQRWKAALELGLETVPVVMVDDDTSDDEIGEMIASNVFRRQIDPFKLFDYVAELRKGHHGKIGSSSAAKSLKNVKDIVHKDATFVSAADIWKTFTDEQKEEFKKRYASEFNHSEGKLIAEMRKIEAEKIEAMEEYKKAKAAAAESEEREKAKQEAIERLETEITVLKSRDVEEELAARDAQIRALEKQKATLNKKLKEPDLNKILDDCIEKQAQVSIKLKDLYDNRDSLDEKKWDRLGMLLRDTIATIGKSMNQTLQIGGDNE